MIKRQPSGMQAPDNFGVAPKVCCDTPDDIRMIQPCMDDIRLKFPNDFQQVSNIEDAVRPASDTQRMNWEGHLIGYFIQIASGAQGKDLMLEFGLIAAVYQANEHHFSAAGPQIGNDVQHPDASLGVSRAGSPNRIVRLERAGEPGLKEPYLIHPKEELSASPPLLHYKLFTTPDREAWAMSQVVFGASEASRT
jgi:hypothetical protein